MQASFALIEASSMIRTVRQTNIKPDRPHDGEPRPFADFGMARNLVLLGDPGAGKTHVFKEAAAAEGGAVHKGSGFSGDAGLDVDRTGAVH